MHTSNRVTSPAAAWKHAAWYAVPISTLVLGLFYYWFGIANRYVVFLYEHLGATPFDRVTRSRYWMAGLVASGIVMLLYTGTTWLVGRIATRQDYHVIFPAWWQVWALCAIPLMTGIPLVVMNVNWPTLPLSCTLSCTATTLAGLALALAPGRWAAQHPRAPAWLALDGLALVPCLSSLRILELPALGIGGIDARTARLGAISIVLFSITWLSVMTGLRAWRRRPAPSASRLLLSGLCLSYLFAPLLHYIVRGYISTATNFFAQSPRLQWVAFGIATVLAVGTADLRQCVLPRQKINAEAQSHRDAESCTL